MQDECQPHPWLDTVLTASAAVAYNTAGYFTRLIELDGVGFGGALCGPLHVGLHRPIASQGDGRVRSQHWAARNARRDPVRSGDRLLSQCLRLTTVAEDMAINTAGPFITGATQV